MSFSAGLAGLVFDVILAAALPLLAWRVLSARDLFRAVVLFIAFGLLVATAWARLGAPDIALAEAAIGAGLTGALFLNAIGGLSGSGKDPGSESAEPTDTVPRAGVTRSVLLIPAVGLAGLLLWAFLSLPEPVVDLPGQVFGAIERGEVSHPVTAVLLNFRSYDTLLEIGVLLLAVLCVWSLRLSPVRVASPASRSPVLAGMVRLLGPAMVVSGIYLLWAGTSQPGGAFQAGAVLGALGVLLVLAGILDSTLGSGGTVRAGLAVGFSVFLLVGVATMLITGTFLQYPAGGEYGLILTIELVLTFSIALTLTALFTASPPRAGGDRRG
ncbi:hydrogenase subunit MbhD domain-containing protein [Rubrobacter indicoceani]|uniref:hydrogenase subunit MbhD domain-containing protein n=1 Tax=Rubrobacter indicoceani TaxID=2051957 RepID=UPI000E5ABD85|nr:hydrogenase subunit MbhD domain-containing protein [Rubrobacter indicoceani]